MPAFAGRTLAHAGLADVNAQLEQLALNPGSAPEWIFAAHGANQLAHLFGHGRPPLLTVSHLPGPEQTKALPVPADDGRGFDDKDAGLPVVPDCAEPSPQEPICRGQFGSLDGALQNAELMAKGEHLELKRRPAPKGGEKRGQKSGQNVPEGERTTPSLPIKSEFARTTIRPKRAKCGVQECLWA